MIPAQRRQVTYLRGLRAETLALLWLTCKGYRLVQRRYAAAGGEIDLIVRRGQTIAFVEVKARATMAQALEAIDARKRARFTRAVRAWLTRYPQPPTLTIRADAIFLAPWSWPRHVEAVFEMEGF